MNAVKIAIVGSGPAGCYTAQFLNKALEHAEITVLDHLPVPFGLIRYGVAPDHVGTKNISKQFERLFASERVHFIGNVEVGKDVSLVQLQQDFDVVVLATGLHQDRQLHLAGECLPGVLGSGYFTRWCNSHPEATQAPVLGERVVIVGNGNVAMDVVRLLSKTAAEYGGSELNEEVLHTLQAAAVKHIDVVGRSDMSAAKYDAVMVKELAKTAGLSIVLGHGAVDSGHPQYPLMQQLANATKNESARVQVVFHYGLQPTAIEGNNHVQNMVFTDTTTQTTISFDADTVITAIGFQAADGASLHMPVLAADGGDLGCGLLQPNLYCVGWARRGPVGTIPENRKDAKLVADAIVAALQTQTLHGNKGGYHTLSQLPHQHTDFADWQVIDQFETNQAAGNRSRRKIGDIGQMLELVKTTKLFT